ncbi:MAG: hypothetical protein NTW87_36120 [Planctomycetota bacterium]|nr:hypothetical protein [Planctomycetota bacterium]
MKSRLIFLLCFLAAFGAGICVGYAVGGARRAAPRDGWLSELNLSPEQGEKIKAIWTDAMKATDWQSQREKREAVRTERDEALRALVTGDQKQRFEEIMSAYQKKADEISQEARKARDEAYERTKAVLTESQRVAYDELRKKRAEAHGRTRTETQKGQPKGSAPEKSGLPAGGEQKQPEGTPATK